MIKNFAYIFIIILVGIFVLCGLVEYSRYKVKNKILSEYIIGETKPNIITKMDKDLIFIEIYGPRHIEKERVLEGYGKPSREIKEGESVIILKDGIYLYFDRNNKLIHKEMVFS